MQSVVADLLSLYILLSRFNQAGSSFLCQPFVLYPKKVEEILGKSSQILEKTPRKNFETDKFHISYNVGS